MSTLLNAAGETLSAILSNAPTEGQDRLVTAWVRQQGTALGSQNYVFYLRADPESEQLNSDLYSSDSAQWIAIGRNGAGSVQAFQTGVVHEEDVWQLVGHYVSGNNGTSNGTLQLGTNGEFRASNSVPYSTPSNRALDRLFIGGWDVSSFGRWRGYVAEFAIWTPADFAAAQAIFAELATKRPDAVAAGTPIFYAPLLSDATVAIGGTTLSVNGTTTFHDDVHPSLADGSAPDAPTIGAVTSVTHNAATVHWTDNSDNETGFKVEYGESSSNVVASWSAAPGSPAAADAETFNLTGLDPSTTYKARVAATNASGDSDWAETAEFTTDPAPDTTPPTLSNPTATATGQTTASGSVTTDEGNGTLYYLASANSSENAATVKGGDSQAVSATGVQNVSVTGLTHSTGYYLHFVHVDAADNESDVASSSQFTTDAPPPPATKGVRIQLSAGAENLTGLSVRWWDDPTATGAPDYSVDNEATDGSRWLEIDLDSTTANDVDDLGYLLVFKAGANPDDDMVAAGRVPIVDISA